MKITNNLINGEVHCLLTRFEFSLGKLYHKDFYELKFVKQVAKRLCSKVPHLKVEISDQGDSYYLAYENISQKRDANALSVS